MIAIFVLGCACLALARLSHVNKVAAAFALGAALWGSLAVRQVAAAPSAAVSRRMDAQARPDAAASSAPSAPVSSSAPAAPFTPAAFSAPVAIAPSSAPFAPITFTAPAVPVAARQSASAVFVSRAGGAQPRRAQIAVGPDSCPAAFVLTKPSRRNVPGSCGDIRRLLPSADCGGDAADGAAAVLPPLPLRLPPCAASVRPTSRRSTVEILALAWARDEEQCGPPSRAG